MQNQLKKIATFTLIVTAMCVTLVAIMSLSSLRASASVADSSLAYESTTTRAAFNGTALGSPLILVPSYGTLGSVIITGAGTGIINIYDATSTAAHSDYATTTLASFPASTAAGTYVFDTRFQRGLVVELIGTVGTTTITWKR